MSNILVSVWRRIFRTPVSRPKFQIMYHDHRLKRLKYATKGSACVDLYACIDVPITLIPGEEMKISSGVSIHIKNPNYVGLIAPRSSVGTKGLVISNTVGIIDSDYTGIIWLTLLNRNRHTAYTINPMDRVCQLGFVRVNQVDFEEVDLFLDETERGSGGFGSSGV